MANPIRVLFLCVHNAARSQMAEALLNQLGGGDFYAESAGFSPGPINPLAIQVMKEQGIDISKNSVDHVFDFYKEGRFYSLAVTVCDEAHHQKCPIFPGMVKTLHWDLPDPSSFEGSWEERLEATRQVAREIEKRIKQLIEEYKDLKD